MVKPQVDELGDRLSPFGIANDDKGEYRKFRTDDTEFDSVYLIKANAAVNTEAHSNIQTQLRAGKVKFLIDEKTAKNKLMQMAIGKKMSAEERAEYLRPFTLTSILREEMNNLREETDNVNIILKQANRMVGKDKFSSSI